MRMEAVMESFDCPACGVGTVAQRPTGPRRLAYRNLRNMSVPSLDLPTCSHCGETWLDKEATQQLHDALEKSFTEVLSERSIWALDKLRGTIRQQDLERLLGLSAGYLSKVKAGKHTSGPLTAALLLLAKDSRRLTELQELFDAKATSQELAKDNPSFFLVPETGTMEIPQPQTEMAITPIPSVESPNKNTDSESAPLPLRLVPA